MRLFVAIVPPPSALAALAERVGLLSEQWPSLRWTGEPAWHLTLAFLGEVDQGVTDELSVRLERVARRHSARTLVVSGAGAFPSVRRARVLWAGIAGDLTELARLAASVAAAARRAGAPPPDEGRRFHAHLTLARSRVPADLRKVTAELADVEGQQWQATSMRLIRSQPGGYREQPSYTDFAAWPLGRASAL